VRRELIWVIAIGVIFGLIIAFGVWRINSEMSKSTQEEPESTPAAQNTGGEFKITLNSPDNNSVVTASPVTVSGITKPLLWIVISGENEDYIVQSDEKGAFTQDVDLTPGANRIGLTAFGPSGSQSKEDVVVVYSSVFELKTVIPAANTDSATGDSVIQKKVAEKVAAALDQPKAYIGLITDITSSTIQIKNSESQIEQIAMGDDGISVIDTKGKVNKQVKTSDIAIGDFIVAMGYVNGDHVLHAQRILITDPLEDSGLSATIAKVADTTAKSLSVTDAVTEEESVVIPNKNTYIATFSEGKTTTIKLTTIKEGDLVIYVTNDSVTPPSIRSLFDV
jgi:hypothetical protein